MSKHIPSKILPSKDFPSKALPPKDLPSKSMPSKNLPSKTLPPKDLPSKAMPSKDLPSKTLPSKDFPSNSSPKNDGRKPRKSSVPDDIASTITDSDLIILRKKYFFPNELSDISCKNSDRVHSPPPGYISVFEMSLKAGLRFPIATEFTAILMECKICLSQLSCRAVMIIIGLIAFFREHGAILTPDFFARIGKFTCDAQGHITCRTKMLDLRTQDASKNWPSRFFFVKNDWCLKERWGKLKDMPVPLHTFEEDILRALKIRTVEDLVFETRFIYKYTREEVLFKFGLSIQPGRTDAQRLKRSEKIIEAPIPARKKLSKRPIQVENDPSVSKKKRATEVVDDELKIRIPEDILNHHCFGYKQTEELFLQRSSIDSKLDLAIKEWNSEFVKIKYTQAEYKKKYDTKVKELRESDDLLEEYRVEIASMATTLSVQQQEIERAQCQTLEAQMELDQALKNLEALEAEKSSLQSNYERRLEELTQTQSTIEKSKVIEEFKDSLPFRTIVQEQVEEAREEIYSSEVKHLERQSLDEGLIRGFLKGMRLVYRRTGIVVDDLTFSQVSEDLVQDLDDDASSTRPVEIESDVDA